MVNQSLPLYQHKVENWDATKCDKAVNYEASDGLGTKYPFKGYLGTHFGPIRYNGGCVRDGEWYQGENFPLPNIPKNFKIVYVMCWGWRIIKI
jgi:hypothetical protein